MAAAPQDPRRRRERTLAVAVLLSAFAPVATGLAVLLSESTAQLADFVRRSVELLALLVSWWAFRRLGRRPELAAGARRRLERTANLAVAAALGVSGAVVLVLAVVRWPGFEPGGNVTLGLAIASLGLLVNGAFWRRYARLQWEAPDPIIGAQRRLYATKAWVDASVIVALGAVALAPAHPLTRHVDLAGSLVVGLYLAYAAYRTAREAWAGRAAPVAP